MEVEVPRMRGKIHRTAFVLSLPAGLILIVLARGAERTAIAALYAASLSAVFGSSAAYHLGSWSDRARRRMKRLDHAMIFVLIAGTYTPLCLLALHGPIGIVMLSIAWAGAVAGVALKLARIDGLRVLTSALYMALGWFGVLALPFLIGRMSLAATILMVVGGILYTLGAIVLARRRPDPRPRAFGYHEIWHAFMVTAAACHWAMVLLLVRTTP